MFARALFTSAIAAGLFVTAITASAEEIRAGDSWIVSPALTESSKTAPPASGLDLDSSPFYSDIAYRGIEIETAAEGRWYLNEGADTEFDADPRDTIVLPRPAPSLVFDLR